MAAERDNKRLDGEHIEERGLVSEVIAPAVSGALGSGVGTYVGNKLSGGGGAPPPSEQTPPEIELPPGVDRDSV